MMSYWFYKMAAIASQIYFRFLVWPRPTFKKMYQIRIPDTYTKFRPDISIHGRYMTTPGFWKQAVTIVKFYFRFRFWPFHCHRHVVFSRHTKFHRNGIGSSAAKLWRQSDFQDGGRHPCWIWFMVMVAHHEVQVVVSALPSNFGVIGFTVLQTYLYCGMKLRFTSTRGPPANPVFHSCNLDLDPMTLICDPDLYSRPNWQ